MALTSSNDMDFNDNFDCDKLIKGFEDDKEEIEKSQKGLEKMFDELNS